MAGILSDDNLISRLNIGYNNCMKHNPNKCANCGADQRPGSTLCDDCITACGGGTGIHPDDERFIARAAAAIGSRRFMLTGLYEHFYNELFLKGEEKGVCAREFNSNTKVFSLNTLRRVALLAFVAGAVSQKEAEPDVEIRRLCD